MDLAGGDKIFQNNTGTLTIVQTLPGYISVRGWIDYDNDGDLDIGAVSGSSGVGISSIYRNDGGAFVAVGSELDQNSNARMAWGDFDNDGDLDLAFSGSATQNPYSILRVYRNDSRCCGDSSIQ